MSDTKKCPYCGEEIKAAAKKCRYCGEWLEEKALSQPSHEKKKSDVSSQPVSEPPASKEAPTPPAPPAPPAPAVPQKTKPAENKQRIQHYVSKTKDKFFRSDFFLLCCHLALICEFFSLAKYAAMAFNLSVADGDLFHGSIWGRALTACRLIPEWFTDLSLLFLAGVAYGFYQEMKYIHYIYEVANPALHEKTVLWAKLLASGFFALGVCYVGSELFDSGLFAALALLCMVFVGVALIVVGKKYKNEYGDEELLNSGGCYVGVIVATIPVAMVLALIFPSFGEGSVGYNIYLCVMSFLALSALYGLVGFIYKEITGCEFKLHLGGIFLLFIIVSFALSFLPESVQKKLEAKAAEIEIENELKEELGSELDETEKEIDLSDFQNAPDDPVLAAETDEAAFFLNHEATEYGESYGDKLYKYDKEKETLTTIDLSSELNGDIIDDYAPADGSLYIISDNGSLMLLSSIDLSSLEVGSIYGVTLRGGYGEDGPVNTGAYIKFTSGKKSVKIHDEDGKDYTYELEGLGEINTLE